MNTFSRFLLVSAAASLLSLTGAGCATSAVEAAPPEKPPAPLIDPLEINDGGPLTATLAVDAVSGEHTLTVADARSGARWTGLAGVDEGWIVDATQVAPEALQLTLLHPAKGGFYDATVTVDGDALLFEMTKQDDVPFEWLNYPPKFVADLEDGRLLFADRSAGQLVPQDDAYYEGRTLLAMGNTGSLDMPMIGVTEGRTGHGYYITYDTPTDIVARIEKPDETSDSIWPQTIWIRQLDGWGYDRTARIVFVPDGGYVAQALRYREDAERQGFMKPLTEKLQERPRVDWLRGAPILWGTDGLDFAREARARGLTRGLLATRSAREDMIELRELGFLTAEYDSYTDFTPSDDLVDAHHDTLDKARYTRDGEPAKGWRTLEGVQYYSMSHYFAVERAKLFLPDLLERYPFTARFIDVSTAIQLDEDWHPDRMFGRARDMEYRKNLFEYMQQDLGLVMGGEHANAWALPVVDYTEGPLSGSFWWESKVGHLVPLESMDEVPERYKRYALDSEIRIPLFDLIFKDQVVSTWYWGDSNGYLFNIWPELSDWKDAVNVLHGAPPLMWGDHLGYGWDRNRERFLQTARVTLPWHEATMYDALTGHEVDETNPNIQRATFSSGAEAVINMGTEPASVTHRSESYLLPYGGIAADADGVAVRRVLIDGDDVIHVETDDGLLYVRQQAARRTAAATGSGSLCFFPLEDGRWGADVKGAWTLDLNALGASPSGPMRLFEVDTVGRLQRELPSPQGRTLQLDGGDEGALFALLEVENAGAAMFLPMGGEIAAGDKVAVSAAGADEVRVTMDGSTPNSRSGLYAGPIELTEGVTLKAQAFRNGVAVGEPVQGSYRVLRRVTEPMIVRGGDGPTRLELDVEGAEELRLVVTDAGDGPAWDSFMMADVVGVTASGEEVPIAEIPVLRNFQTSREDPRLDLTDIEMSGEDFDTGIFCHARAEITWDLGGRFVRIEGWHGTNQPEGNGSVEVTFTGVY